MQPLVKTIETSLSAYQVFSIFCDDGAVAFLESQPNGGQSGRYSILGLNPYRTLRGWPGRCVLDGKAADADPFALLDQILRADRNDQVGDLPLSGGCIGYIAYDAGFPLVTLETPDRAVRAAYPSQPVIGFDFFDNFLIFDHVQGKVSALACGRLEPAASSLERLERGIREWNGQSADERLRQHAPGSPWIAPLPTAASYMAKVEEIREQIRDGEVYIANLTHVLSAATDVPSSLLLDRLRRLNPAPYAAFIRQGSLEILSASPERFIRIRHDPDPANPAAPRFSVETCPIKGTRPRGRDPAEDSENARALLASGKDRSELLMIVDLERNDLSRVCRPDSVRVDDLFRLETYPTVHHLVATVRGILRDGVSPVGVMQACFPGGSITGAPKVAAMQIIDRLEDKPRGLYTGCLGYFSFDGQADFNIIIRTLVRSGRTLSYGSGGGITWESDAASEYQEMLLKAQSFLQLVGMEG